MLVEWSQDLGVVARNFDKETQWRVRGSWGFKLKFHIENSTTVTTLRVLTVM